MSATDLSPRSAPTASAGVLTAAGIIRSEWIKLRTLRSTVWSYAIVIGMSLGLAALLALTFQAGLRPGFSSRWSRRPRHSASISAR